MPSPNPKAARAVADGKAPLDYLERVCDAPEARVLAHGAAKYGRRNFRDTTIDFTTYVGAIHRHLNAWALGEDADPDSGEHHLTHVRACCAVVLSAIDAGTYNDDRGFKQSLAPTTCVEEWSQRAASMVAHTDCGTDDCCGECPTAVPAQEKTLWPV